MRIFSNTLLNWPDVLHVFHAARLSPHQWQSYSFYRIQKLEPFMIRTNSCPTLLEPSRQFYCYETYHRNTKLEQSNCVKLWNYERPVWIPSLAIVNDLIVIRQD